MSSPDSLTPHASGGAAAPGHPSDRRQRLLEALIESVFDGVLIVSHTGEMIYHNQLFLDIWNFPPEVLALRSDEAALQWAAGQTADPAGFLARVSAVYQNTGERVREEITMKDGRIYERCGSAVRTGDGHEPWMWTFRDISGRKQNENALQLSELRYRTLFNSIDEGFCVIRVLFDRDGRPDDYLFLEVNPAFHAHTGMDNPVGRRMREFAPDHEAHWFERYGRVALTGEATRFEHEARALNRWFEVNAFPVDGPGLHCVGVLFTDVTARRLASDSLRASEQFNRAVMESSPDCIKVLDPEGKLQFMNTGGLCLMEIGDLAPYLNQPWGDLWQSGDQAMVAAALASARQGTAVRFQAMCPTAKGNHKWWDVMLAPFHKGDPGGDLAGLLSVSRDITDSKEAEQELRLAKETAELASQAKDRFLATLSHELRTPLNPVLLTVSSLTEDPDLPPAIAEQLRMIERNISLEARLIDDLLDISRIASGKLQLRNEPCDIHALIGLVMEMVREDARQKSIAISLDLAARVHGMIGDPARLQQVLWNLLRNAVKFTPHGGQIHVRTRDTRKSAAEPRLHIEVEDSGMGIAPEALHAIFDPFEQEQRSRHSASGGLGLGLAIARAVMDLHHGILRAESRGPGGGATFFVEAPAVSLPDAGPLPVAGESSGRGPSLKERPMRLLLVEDHPATLEALTVLLTKAGHGVTAVGTLAGARAAAAAQSYDGLISDVGLPDGNGFELMEELSARYGLRGIVLSGYGMEDDLRRSREVGFVAHLVKPVRIRDLRETLHKLHTPEIIP